MALRLKIGNEAAGTVPLHIFVRTADQTKPSFSAFLSVGDKEAKVACIGPAGENLVPISVIMVETNHQAAKGGIGAVMGSKKVKAIAVKGSGKVQVAASDRLDRIAERWRKLVLESELPSHMKDAGGTRTGHVHEEKWGIPPARKNRLRRWE